MNNLGNLLWKIFSVTMAFVCHIDSNCAFAEESETTPVPVSDVASIVADPKMTTQYFISTDDVGNRNTHTIKLCQSGQYLGACGKGNKLRLIGTNWLKGLKKSDGTETPDYYSYNTQTSDTIHMENLKKLFAHTEPLIYTSRSKPSGSLFVYATSVAYPEDYKWHLYQLLSNFCTDEDGNVPTDDIIHCAPCPNNAYVERSTVQQDAYDTGKILWDSWNVHTIADCYMNEFEDTDGTYVYASSGSQDTLSKTNCFYTKNFAGSSLVRFYNQ